MQIHELMSEAVVAARTDIPAANASAPGGQNDPGPSTPNQATQQKQADQQKQQQQDQPVTPQAMTKALAPLGVVLPYQRTEVLHQYFTKIGGKTTQLKKTGDPYADTILTMFGYELR